MSNERLRLITTILFISFGERALVAGNTFFEIRKMVDICPLPQFLLKPFFVLLRQNHISKYLGFSSNLRQTH